MIFCRNCKRLNGLGTVYCQGCSGTFGKRLCKKKHVAATDADFCPVCGSDKLSSPVRYMNLTWASRGLAWGVTLLSLWTGWRVCAPLLQSHLSAALGTQTMSCLAQQAFAWAAGLAFVWLVLLVVLPSHAAKALGKLLKAVVKLATLLLRGAVALLRLGLAALGLLFRLMEGRRAPPT